MKIIQKHQHGRGIVAASDNTRTDTRRQAEMAYQNRPRTKLQFRKETADRKAEEAIKEREARRKDPEYDEKKRRAQVNEQLRQNDDGKYTSNKKTFVERLADNLYHNSGAAYYVDRAKELAKEGASPLEQLTNAGVGLIGTVANSAIGGVDAIGNVVSPKSNVGTNTMGLLTETPIGAIPMMVIDAARQYGGARGENVAELATVIAGGRRPRFQPRPVRLRPGQRGIPTIRIEGNGTPRYDWATPNPNRSSWEYVGANVFEPMSRSEIAEAIQNGTLQYADLNGNVLGTWRNIDYNGGVHVQMTPTRNGGRFLPNDRPVPIYLPNGQRVEVSPSIAREYLNGTRRYPSFLNDTETQLLSNTLGGVSAEFDGYGILGPRYRVNYGHGPSVVYRYPEIQRIIENGRYSGSLEQAVQGLTDPNEILATKWNWMEKNASNPGLVKSIRQAVESGQDTSPILSKLSNKQIDYLVEQGMLKKPKHTGNLVGIIDSDGPRPFSLQEVEESIKNDWNNRRHGSVFDFDSTNSYSYQSHLKALLTAIKKIEAGEARLLRPGTKKIYPNNYAAIKVTSPTGDVKTYFGDGIGRAGGAMELSKLNRHYKFAYDKLNELGRKQYGDQWSDLTWEDITPEQIERQYNSVVRPRTHADLRFLIYKNGGKTKLYDRRFISKIKGV